jgi:hypothetical protein
MCAIDEDRSVSELDLLGGQLTLRHAVLAELVLEVLEHRLLLDEHGNRVLAIDLPHVTISVG